MFTCFRSNMMMPPQKAYYTYKSRVPQVKIELDSVPLNLKLL
jgi:hypothetical protein